MRRHIIVAVALALVAGLASQSRAQDTKSVIDKALKAMGGEKKLAEIKAASWKGKGTISFGGEDNAFTSETTLAGLDHVRASFEANIMGNEIKATTVVAGDKGWRVFADMKSDIDKEGLANETRMMYLQLIPVTLLPLRQKDFKMAASEVEKVDGKPAAVLKITGPDGKDFKLYFDQETGLPVKQVAKVIDFTGQEFTQESSYAGYKDFDGIKKATKIESKRDGEKFVNYEITEFKVYKAVEPSTFKEPD